MLRKLVEKLQRAKPALPDDAFEIRWMRPGDEGYVLEIERESFGDQAWCGRCFDEILRQHEVVATVLAANYWEDERGEAQFAKEANVSLPIGYLIYRLTPTQGELLRFAVHPFFRRERVGSALVGLAMAKMAHRPSRKRVFCRVPERRLGAQLFLKHMGFMAVRIHKGEEEDEIEMARSLTGLDGEELEELVFKGRRR